MQRLEVSGAVRPIYGSLGVKRLNSGGERIYWFWIRNRSDARNEILIKAAPKTNETGKYLSGSVQY